MKINFLKLSQLVIRFAPLLLVCALFLAFGAWAQEPSGDTHPLPVMVVNPTIQAPVVVQQASFFTGFLSMAMPYVVFVGLIVVLTLGAWLCVKAHGALHAIEEDKKQNKVVVGFAHATDTVVSSIEGILHSLQSTVDAARADPSKIPSLKADVLAQLKANGPSAALSTISAVLGGAADSKLENVVSNAVASTIGGNGPNP